MASLTQTYTFLNIYMNFLLKQSHNTDFHPAKNEKFTDPVLWDCIA